jgi:uncharacterized protein (TIGR03083 family)
MSSSDSAPPVDDYIQTLALEGSQLATAAARSGLDAPVPSCPGWTVTELLRHLAYVHDWAASHVSQGLVTPLPTEPEELIVSSGPAGLQLLAHYVDANRNLVTALQSADPAIRCWSFLPAASPLTFWARRQAHETTIHRVDAELAAGSGASVTRVTAEFAADGIDELLFGFCSPARKRRSLSERSLELVATDIRRQWLIRADPHGFSIKASTGTAQYQVRGPAACLYLLLWNRPGGAGLDADGDSAVIDWWHRDVRITWE